MTIWLSGFLSCSCVCVLTVANRTPTSKGISARRRANNSPQVSTLPRFHGTATPHQHLCAWLRAGLHKACLPLPWDYVDSIDLATVFNGTSRTPVRLPRSAGVRRNFGLAAHMVMGEMLHPCTPTNEKHIFRAWKVFFLLYLTGCCGPLQPKILSPPISRP